MKRRRFLYGSLAGAAGLTILRNPASAWTYQANQKLNVALVGVGGRGTWFVDTIPRMENVVALCDVNQQKIGEAMKHWEETGKRYATSPNDWERSAGAEFRRLAESKPKVFADFRKMLSEMGKQIDAVVVATPDHTHAAASAAVIAAGKAVFCEKPLTRTLAESRALRELARKHKAVTSMGNQGTYSGAFRRALELIRNGTLGEIKEVHVWNDGGGADCKQPPKGQEPVPQGLQWDLWLGPAAERPFHLEWMHWHQWRDFGTCQLGNWGSHTANLAFMALRVHELWLAEPPSGQRPQIRIGARSTGINRLSFPRWEIIDWEIPARSGLPPITITWYNGAVPGVGAVLERAGQGIAAKDKGGLRFAGTLIVGTKGAIHTTGHNMSFRLLPEDQFKGVQRQRPETVDDSRGAEQDWFAACRGGKRPWANFDYASALNEFLQLGNVATQFEGKLEFEPIAMKVVNNPAADAALHCEYRKGWTL